MSITSPRFQKLAAAAVVLLAGASAVQAKQVQITVTSESLVPANSVSFAPLHVAFHNGMVDTFNLGEKAGPGITTIAELASGAMWHDEIAAQQADSVRGSLGGLLMPGHSTMHTFVIDTDKNQYFSFAGMVVPSNDFFIGNDSGKAYKIVDSSGNQLISNFTVQANEIWDAGSEVFDPTAAAFVAGADAMMRTPQKSVVAFNFAELAAFDGMQTAAGYQFHSGLTANQDIYRVSFQVAAVPEPETYALMGAGLMTLAMLGRRRRAKA